MQTEGKNSTTITGAAFHPLWASSFRRTQLVFALWGVIMLVGGLLHQNYSRSWGIPITLLGWLGLTILGVVGSYLLTPAFLNSGMLTVWLALLVVGFLLTALFALSLNLTGPPVAIIWNLIFLIGYTIIGYFMDRRLWLLAGWTLLVTLALIFFGLTSTTPAPATTASTPAASSPYGDYDEYSAPPATPVTTPATATPFQFRSNQALILAFTSAIPLLLVALPFWKERNIWPDRP